MDKVVPYLVLFIIPFISCTDLGSQVWLVTPETTDQVENLYQLSQFDVSLDFWTDARLPGDEAQIMVPGENRDTVQAYLDTAGLKYEVMIDNVENYLDEQEKERNLRRLLRKEQFDYDDFNTYEEIMTEMEALSSRCRNDLDIFCETYSIGRSVEGRDQRILKVYKNEIGRFAYWMDSQIHAREWLSVATNLKIARHIITAYDSDEEAKRLMDDGDWYFLFVHNPDGYVYSWTNERLWRKNRSTNAGTSCRGVDLNRNFEYRWGNVGASSNPCSSTYKGPMAASEPETQNVQREILRLAPTLKAFNSIHTAARIILMPWGSVESSGRCEYLAEPEQSQVDSVAKGMARAIADTFGYSSWRGGNSCATIYPASGLTQDYARAYGGIKYSFTPELRDRGSNGVRYGFTAPPSEIEPSFREMWRGFVRMVEMINDLES